MIESTALGGQAGTSRRIENYLGFPAGISGTELTTRAVTQARKFGARIGDAVPAVALEPGDERHVVRLDGGQEVAARAVVLATGAEYRRLAGAPTSRTTRASASSTPPARRRRGVRRDTRRRGRRRQLGRRRPRSGSRAAARS